MSLETDQAELRAKNREYLEKTISEFFASAFGTLEAEYKAKVKAEVFDSSDKTELNLFYKKAFSEVEPGPVFEKASIENENFVFDWEEIKATSTFENLVYTIYPILEEGLKIGRPNEFTRLLNRLNRTTRREYLKHINSRITEKETSTESAEVSSFIPDLTVFKNPESHRFFNYLYENWLKKKPDCRPQLSFILSTMDGNRSKFCGAKDYGIVCKKTEFREFWNALPHPYKIGLKKNGAIDLSTDPAAVHKDQYSAIKEAFDNNN